MSARQTKPAHSPIGRPTYREVEIKLRVADAPALLKRLHGLGATSHGRVLEQNTLYDTPGSYFRSRSRLLRLRIETPSPGPGPVRAVLTAKAPTPVAGAGSRRQRKSRFKERLERELVVKDPHRWPSILRSLGLRPAFRYEKYRSEFRLPGVHVYLDETPAGSFLELEGSPRAIDRAAKALGFTRLEYFRGTYWDVYAADCRRKGLTPRNMLFVR
jgi:adenylate cyclase, class 2